MVFSVDFRCVNDTVHGKISQDIAVWKIVYLKSISEAIPEDFRKRPEDVSNHISKYVLSFKHNINEVINIFTSENMEITPSSRGSNVFLHEFYEWRTFQKNAYAYVTGVGVTAPHSLFHLMFLVKYFAESEHFCENTFVFFSTFAPQSKIT